MEFQFILGHADDHSDDVYCLLNLETNKVVFSRDVQWLEQNYCTFMKSQGLEDDDHEDDAMGRDMATFGMEEMMIDQVFSNGCKNGECGSRGNGMASQK